MWVGGLGCGGLMNGHVFGLVGWLVDGRKDGLG